MSANQTKTNNGVSEIFTIVAKDGSKATVHSQGGHVTSWVGKEGDERLYMSPKTVIQAGKALRGGIPIIYPQFNDMGYGPSHGVARSRQWKRIDDGSTPGVGIFSFTIPMDDTVYTGAASTLVLTVNVSDSELKLVAKVTPTEYTKDRDFGFLFHTYFAVSDVNTIQVEGFSHKAFANGRKNRVMEKTGEFTSIQECVDSIFFKNTEPIRLIDPGLNRTFEIFGSKTLPDVVLWNPGKETIGKLSDVPQPDGYKKFVCIEHGAVQPKVPFPKLGGSWEGSQTIRVAKNATLKSKL